MHRAIGFAQGWHVAGPVTEGELAARLDMKPGEKYLMTGAFFLDGVSFVVSHAARQDDTITLYGVEFGRGPTEKTVHPDSAELFADGVSLAW